MTHAPPHEGDCFFSHGENRSNQKRPSSGSPAVLHLACILSLISGLLPQASPSAQALQPVASHSLWNIALITVPSPSNLSLDPAFSSTHHSLPISCSTAPRTRELCRLTPASLFSFSLHHCPSRSVATSGLQLSVLVSSDLSAACATGLLCSFCLEALLSHLLPCVLFGFSASNTPSTSSFCFPLEGPTSPLESLLLLFRFLAVPSLLALNVGESYGLVLGALLFSIHIHSCDELI